MKRFSYFSKGEILLWASSAAVIVLTYFGFGSTGLLPLIASLIGVTSLIFCAKGNPIGQALMLVFSVLYSLIAYSRAYYGEVVTYLGMAAPMALFALIAWLRHPFRGKKSEVAVNALPKREYPLILLLTAAVTAAFGAVLYAWDTANLTLSTVSVATSFFAVVLTFRRSPLYALAYAANDIVLIALWIAMRDWSVVACFAVFLVNDLYGFYSWRWMQKRQSKADGLPLESV